MSSDMVSLMFRFIRSILRTMRSWAPRRRLYCSIVRFHEPAHQKRDASTVALKTWILLPRGALRHRRISTFLWKEMVAFRILCSSSTSKLLSKVTMVPRTLKPTILPALYAISPLISIFDMTSSSIVVHQVSSLVGVSHPTSPRRRSHSVVICHSMCGEVAMSQ